MKNINLNNKQVVTVIIFVFLFAFSLFNIQISSQGKVSINGNIGQNEYSNRFSFDKGNFILYCEIVDDMVYFGIESTATGWVSIGIDPSNKMKDSDMIIGVVTDKETTIFDTYCTGLFGPHKDDTSLGGSFDILSFAGKKTSDRVYLEFSRKTDTKDSKDKPILKGKDIKIIWAYSKSTNISSTHSKRGTETINIK
jgi:hypothetical protein